MNLDEASLKGAAQRGLVRILRMALPEDDKCQTTIREALRSADKLELPTDPDELLLFVRVHLAPQLTMDIGPSLVLALIDDLTAEIELLKAGKDPASSSRIRAATAPPAGGARAEDSPARETESSVPKTGVIGRLPFPKLRQSVANLVRTASTSFRAVVTKNPLKGLALYADPRPSVLLVHPDRLMRSSMARALVNARFDVTVFDSASHVLPALRTRQGVTIAILDAREDGIDSVLHALIMANPGLRIVAWTEAPPIAAESALRAAGVQRFAVLSKTATAVELVYSARQLLDDK